jgi:hypothetical protein
MSETLDTLNLVLPANYRSGDDFVVEFLGHQFEFSADDFAERVTAAAVRLGLVASNDLDEDEAADLVELVADGRIVDPRSGLGLYLVRHWEHVSLVKEESLVYWLRKLVFRGAWLDHRVKDEPERSLGIRSGELDRPHRADRDDHESRLLALDPVRGE